MSELRRNLIDGEWLEGEAIANINPSDTNEMLRQTGDERQ